MNCPNCNNINAYYGILFVECPNSKCRFFSKKQYDIIAKETKKKVNEELLDYLYDYTFYTSYSD